MTGAGGHGFAVGEVVEFLPRPDEPAVESGRCEVTRLRPRDEGEWCYHVRSASGGHAA